jgi:hypothetical protein
MTICNQSVAMIKTISIGVSHLIIVDLMDVPTKSRMGQCSGASDARSARLSASTDKAAGHAIGLIGPP